MGEKKRNYCPQCGEKISNHSEHGIKREYCWNCDKFFYYNPLPVVSAIVIRERQVLLVKRKNAPYKNKWCLPSGFAETGESIQQACLRELKEETGIIGEITGLVDAHSTSNYYYGDLIFHTFEIEQTSGKLQAGDDAVEVKYFPIHDTPVLAFKSNTKALDVFIKSKTEYWAIIDSFTQSIAGLENSNYQPNFLSDILVQMIQNNASLIAKRWIKDIITNASTPNYKKFDHATLFKRINTVLSQFEEWLGGQYYNKDIHNFYYNLGKRRKKEGFKISEVLSALSLTKKHLWEFALSHNMWVKTIDIYRTLELDRRVVIFFDKAAYYVCKGFEEN